ncbi:hypothetical protein HYT24_03550 [Candidatus Pacearchaeota archaeon]|nr:hypothetical protein [Candidatus Pacearchaeota archaeon]
MRDGVSGVHRRTPGINDYDEARRLHEATLNYIVGYFDSKGIPIEVDRHLNQVYIPNPNSESLEQTRGR